MAKLRPQSSAICETAIHDYPVFLLDRVQVFGAEERVRRRNHRRESMLCMYLIQTDSSYVEDTIIIFSCPFIFILLSGPIFFYPLPPLLIRICIKYSNLSLSSKQLNWLYWGKKKSPPIPLLNFKSDNSFRIKENKKS